MSGSKSSSGKPNRLKPARKQRIRDADGDSKGNYVFSEKLLSGLGYSLLLPFKQAAWRLPPVQHMTGLTTQSSLHHLSLGLIPEGTLPALIC